MFRGFRLTLSAASRCPKNPEKKVWGKNIQETSKPSLMLRMNGHAAQPLRRPPMPKTTLSGRTFAITCIATFDSKGNAA